MAVIRHYVCFLITIALVLISGSFAVAQTCRGGLGDPIVNITFGTGTGYGPALVQGTTNFTPASSCPGDNAYAIVDQCTTCYTGNWHAVTHDHTGDANGRFMLVNATTAPKDFYVRQLDGLCTGTSYQFSAWVLNMMTATGSDPDLSFSIEQLDGTQIESFDTRNIPKTANADWKQYSFEFSMPADISSVIIRIHNNGTSDLGNDIALDDIMFRPVGPSVSAGIQGIAGSSTTMCQYGMIQLTSTVGLCYTDNGYRWQVSKDNGIWTDLLNGTGPTTSFTPTVSGTYRCRLAVSNNRSIGALACRVLSAPLTVTVNPGSRPTITITTNSQSVCASTPVTFVSTASGVEFTDQIYNWQIDGKTVAQTHGIFTTSDLKEGDEVKCIIEPYNACSTPAISNTIVMHVSGTAPSVNISTASINVCKSSPVIFKAAVNPSTNITYYWQKNGEAAGTNSDTFETSDIKDGDIINCQVIRISSCYAPAATSNDIRMRVIDAINSISINTPATSVCGGTPVTFTAAPATAASYQWLVNDKPAGQGLASFTSSDLQNGDVVSCRAISSTACNTPIPSNNITMQVSQPATSIIVSAPSSRVCKGTPVTFTATADRAIGVSYRWLINGQTVTGSRNTLERNDLSNNDVVSCQAASADNCAPPVSSNEITMIVDDLPQISLARTFYEIYGGESTTLESTATGNGLIYKWSPATGLDRTDVANPTAHPNQTTQYTLSVTTAVGCTQNSDPVTVKVLIKQIVVPNTFTPNNDGVNDKWDIPGLISDANAVVQVYNRYGLNVYYSHGYQSAWDGSFRKKTLPTGVYYYTIHLSNSQKLAGYVTIVR